MNITTEWLRDTFACFEGRNWFEQNFPEGVADRDEVLKMLEEVNRLDYYTWLVGITLATCPFPRGWVLPARLWMLYLGGGTLPEGTVLPEGLKALDTGGGTLPCGTVLPESLELLYLRGGTLPKGLVIPVGCSVIA